MTTKFSSPLRATLLSSIIVFFSVPAYATPPSSEGSSIIDSSLITESSLFTPFAGLSFIPAISLYQPLYRSNRVHLYDGPNLIESGKFNTLYPSIGASLRIQSGFWWLMPFIGGPTEANETAIKRNIPFWGVTKVSLERTVYGGLMLGRDLFRLNPFSPFESFALLSSAESASYGSSFLSQSLILGMGIGFRVVGDELELDVEQAGQNTDNSINVEPVAEMYARYQFENNFELSTGIKVAYVEERDVKVGNFFRTETDDDIDVNLSLSIGYKF